MSAQTELIPKQPRPFHLLLTAKPFTWKDYERRTGSRIDAWHAKARGDYPSDLRALTFCGLRRLGEIIDSEIRVVEEIDLATGTTKGARRRVEFLTVTVNPAEVTCVRCEQARDLLLEANLLRVVKTRKTKKRPRIAMLVFPRDLTPAELVNVAVHGASFLVRPPA